MGVLKTLKKVCVAGCGSFKDLDKVVKDLQKDKDVPFVRVKVQERLTPYFLANARNGIPSSQNSLTASFLMSIFWSRHPIKLIIKKGKVRNDGTSLIFLQYCYSADHRVLLSTGVAIPPNFWNRKSGRISKELPPVYGNIEFLEKRLTDKLRKAEDVATHAIKKGNVSPMQFLKENFKLSDTCFFIQHLNNAFNLPLYCREPFLQISG